MTIRRACVAAALCLPLARDATPVANEQYSIGENQLEESLSRSVIDAAVLLAMPAGAADPSKGAGPALFEGGDAVLDRELDESGKVVDSELLHHPGAVGFHGLW